MNKRNWIVGIIVAILGFFGIGVGVRKHQKKKQAELDERQYQEKKRDRLFAEVQKNQLELQKNQQYILKMLKKMRDEEDEDEIDPNEVEVVIDDDEEK